MNNQTMMRVGKDTLKEIGKYKLSSRESYDEVLQRFFGLRRTPKQFKLKETNYGKEK